MEPFRFGGVTISPSIKLGYEKIGLNFSLPLLTGNAVDLSLRDAKLAVGGLGISATIGNRFAIFATAEATLTRSVEVCIQEGPSNLGQLPVSFAGSEFRQGNLEAGLVYRFPGDVSLVGGLRRSRIIMRLDPMSSSTSSLVSYSLPLPPPFALTFSFSQEHSRRSAGDFDIGLWIPFLGVQITGPNYRGALLGSPVGWVQLGIPLGFQATDTDAFSASGWLFFPWLFSISDRHTEQSEIRYRFKNSGVFLQGDFEYDVPLGSGFGLSLWAKGNWMRFPGTGSGGYTLNVSDQAAVFFQLGSIPPIIIDFQQQLSSAVTDSSSAQGSLNIFGYSVGASATVSF
jgi:hypothetical protein